MYGTELNKTTSFNISNEVIRVAGAPGKYNRYTNAYEPFYTRPQGQNIEQQAYMDKDWESEASIVYNQPNNLRGILITPSYILAIFYKPVKFFNKDGKITQRLYNIQPYEQNLRQALKRYIQYQSETGSCGPQPDNRIQVSQPIRWLTTPRIYQNIEEIIFDIRIFQMDQSGKEHIKQILDATNQALAQFKDSSLIRLKVICLADKVDIDPKKLLEQSQIIQTLQYNEVPLKVLFKSANIQSSISELVTRPEYYRYDLEVLKPLMDKLRESREQLEDEQKNQSISEFESLMKEYKDKFGDQVASKMIQIAVNEAINKVGSSVYTPKQMKQKLMDELQTQGKQEFSSYLG